MIFGNWTVAELKDLLNNKDLLIKQTQVARDAFVGPTSDPDWDSDWQAFLKRYQAARTNAQHAIDLAALNVLVSDSVIAADAEYKAMLKAMSQAYPTLQIQKGDLSDLQQRIGKMGIAVQFSNPQPVAQDVDLSTYKAADTAQKAEVAAVQAAGSAAKSAFQIVPWYVWALGGLGLVVGIKVLK